MRQRFALFLVVTVLFLGACKHPNTRSVIDLGVVEFKEHITNKDVILLDVRTAEEISEGRIEGAKHLDYTSATFHTDALMISKELPLFLYCRSGGRSSKAAHFFAANGYTKVYNLVGGITAWEKENYQLIKEE